MANRSTPLLSKTKAHTNPFVTPMRRFLFRLEWSKSSHRRTRKSTDRVESPVLLPVFDTISETSILPLSLVGATKPELHTIHSPPKTIVDTPIRRARVAIQQEDDGFDAVVLTTLHDYPFCCHEDLLTMSREQLLSVVHFMNSRLPATNQIPVDSHFPDALIRSFIEVLVGIMPDTPQAPRAIKSSQTLSVAMDQTEDESESDFWMPSPPSSPLAMREKRRKAASTSILASPPRFLERLDEEDEGDGEACDLLDLQPFKRRRVSAGGRCSKVVIASPPAEGFQGVSLPSAVSTSKLDTPGQRSHAKIRSNPRLFLERSCDGGLSPTIVTRLEADAIQASRDFSQPEGESNDVLL